jgi:hypothetical protein
MQARDSCINHSSSLFCVYELIVGLSLCIKPLLFALIFNNVRPLVVFSAILAVHNRLKPRLDLSSVSRSLARLEQLDIDRTVTDKLDRGNEELYSR